MDPALHLEQLYKKKNETLRIVHIYMYMCAYLYMYFINQLPMRTKMLLPKMGVLELSPF